MRRGKAQTSEHVEKEINENNDGIIENKFVTMTLKHTKNDIFSTREMTSVASPIQVRSARLQSKSSDLRARLSLRLFPSWGVLLHRIIPRTTHTLLVGPTHLMALIALF